MNLINNLKATNSRIQKEIILANISNLEWRMFSYAYHPDSIYHMKCRMVDMEDLGEPTEKMFDLLDKIVNKEISGNDAKMKVKNFAGQYGNLIRLIVNKDLDCGVTATLFNKVYPGAIPQFKVQLAKEVPLTKVDFPVLAQLKYDGVRLIALVEDRKCTFKTRNGKVVNLPELQAAIEWLPFDNYILDGEVVLETGKQEDRTKISGMINSAMHGGTIDEEEVVLHCFDTMPLSDFNSVKCDKPYSERFAILRTMLIATEDKHIQLAFTNEVHNAESVTTLYQGALTLGYEGLVLKYSNHLYTFKRSKDWIKIKEVKDADLKCTAIQEGTGKYKDMIGALVCKGTVEDKEVTVNVGTGLSDVERSMDDIEFIGETIEVQYNTVIEDTKTGQWSLFLPRFVCIRTDK